MQRASKSVNKAYRKAKAISKGLVKFHSKPKGSFSNKSKK